MDEINNENNDQGSPYKFGVFYYENSKRLIVRNPDTGRFDLNYNNKWAWFITAAFILAGILKCNPLGVFGK